MAEIRWTEEAANWLREIHDYITQDSPSGAAKVLSGIYESMQLLKSFPELGNNTNQNLKMTHTSLLYGHYRIAYLIKGKKRSKF